MIADGEDVDAKHRSAMTHEIPRLREARDHPSVETSPLPVRRTLDQIGIPKSTFYAWYDRYLAGGLDALEDRKPRPKRVWNRIADDVREKVLELALDQPELSPREVAVTFTDRQKTFVSEASVYRLLKAEA